jgi:NAD(P)-dependent dehydrogenase (short-subunit alcohol dehydrogenase family)
MNDRLFANKVVLVTGASSGIGRACGPAFAREGARLALTGRHPGRLEAAAALVREAGAEVFALPGDLTDRAFRERLAASVRERFGRLDALVNAAGIIGSGTLESTSLEALDALWQADLVSLFHLTQLVLPLLKASKGAVVNVSSVTGLRAFPGVMAYCIVKAAVDQFTRCAALELAASGVRMNAINPGVVRTNLHRASGMDEEKYAAFLERSKETHPLGRVGTPEEAAELILFLASDRAGWITGDTVALDGGRAQTCAR